MVQWSNGPGVQGYRTVAKRAHRKGWGGGLTLAPAHPLSLSLSLSLNPIPNPYPPSLNPKP